jgi:signal transduction histidine kinase
MSANVDEASLGHFQERMVFYQRQAMLGSMLGVVIHEYNNLLNTALNRTEMAMMTDDSASRTKCLRIAYEHMQKMDQLARHLAAVAHGDETPAQPCAVAELVDAAVVSAARPFEKDRIELDLQVPGDLQVKARPLLFEQVILNLLLNARAAMRDRTGRLSVAARRDGDAIIVEVSDAGVGIPADVLENTINPFLASDASTEPGDWRAVGLGLNACRTIAQQHGATIRGRVNDGPGCTFQLTWPAA